MIDHVSIFLYIMTLLIGAGAVVYTHQLQKTYSFPFLKPLEIYVFFYNLLVLRILAMKYLSTNLLGDIISVDFKILNVSGIPIQGIVFYGLTYSFIGIVMGLLGRMISVHVRRLFHVLIITFIFCYGIGVMLYIQRTSSLWLFMMEKCLVWLVILIIYSCLTFLFMGRKETYNAYHKRVIHSFGYFYIVGYIFPFSAFFFPHTVYLYINAIFLLLMNFIPFIWFNYFFLKYHGLRIASLREEAFNEEITSKYHITRREWEIAQLILRGKSNKEIEKELFISIHTVKNHIQSLFRKLGVKSRGQLVNFIFETQKKV